MRTARIQEFHNLLSQLIFFINFGTVSHQDKQSCDSSTFYIQSNLATIKNPGVVGHFRYNFKEIFH